MEYLIATNSVADKAKISWNADAEASPLLSPTQIQELFQQEAIDGLTNVYKAGWNTWKPLSEVEELKACLVTEEDDESAGEETTLQPTDTTDERANLEPVKSKNKKSKKKRKLPPNTAVFVKGLPLDITEEAFVAHMKRGGVIKIHPDTLKPHVKLYADDKDNLTGEGLVVYGRAESVDLALRYLNDSEIEEGFRIQIEKATFKFRDLEKPAEDFDQELRKKRKIAAEIEQKRLLSWADDTPAFSATKKASTVLLLKPCWTEDHCAKYKASSHFYTFITELIKIQLDRMKTAYKRVVAVPRHPLGVVCIKFKSSEEAEAFIEFCQRRDVDLSPLRAYPGFEGQQSSLTFYDGQTDLRAQTQGLDNTYVFDLDEDLDGLDRLWLQSCGLPQQMLFPTQTQKAELSKKIHEASKKGKLEAFGDWLEEQSSDEEFTIQAEADDDGDDFEDA